VTQRAGGLRAAVTILVTTLILAVPLLTEDSYYIQVASAMGLAVILALSLGLLYGYTGQMSFAQAGFMGIGAYASAVLTTTYHLDFWVTLLPAVLLPGAVAYLVGIPTLRLHGHYLAIATLALQLGINSFFVQASAITGGTVGIFGIQRPSLFGLPLTSSGTYYEVIAVAAIASFFFAQRIVASRFGRALTGVRGDEAAASMLGISTSHYKTTIFAISAMMAGLAGALFAYQLEFISPVNFDLNMSITVLSMVVIGGVGSNIGAVLGAVFLTIVRQLLFGVGDLEFLVYGVLIILTLLIFRGGLAGVGRLLADIVGNRRPSARERKSQSTVVDAVKGHE
jgi:branched-chain amino acid transport system permease protein